MDLKTTKAIFLGLTATVCLLLSTTVAAPTDDLAADEVITKPLCPFVFSRASRTLRVAS